MSEAITWQGGDAEVQRRVEAALQGHAKPDVLRDNPRRRLMRRDDLLIKRFRTGGHHALRERLKAAIGRSPADRERHFLQALHGAGVPVPAPLAWGRLAGGDRILVLPFLEGESGAPGLAAEPARRRAQLEALGRTVRAVHASGVVHGDLHAGNVLFTARGPVLLDLQHARRGAGPAARRRDLGELDYSLWFRASLADRLRIRRAATTEPDADELRAIGEAARAKAWRHGRSRTRRLLRAGRQAARLRTDAGRGLRWHAFPETAAAEALAAHREALAKGDAGPVLKDDGRSRITRVAAGGRGVLVKEVLPRGPLRVVADAFRGSPAWRAWRGGHGLRERGLGAALPLAMLEARVLGFPVRSWLVLEDLSPACDLLALPEAARLPALGQLGPWLTGLHLRGIDHGDLKASHLFAHPDAPGAPPVLIDLEGLRFRRRLPERRRLRALAELNASLPDAWPAEARCRAFLRYATFESFAGGRARALREIVRASLARRHRWQGRDCDVARASRP